MRGLHSKLTVRDPGEGRNEVVLADDGEPDEHVDCQQDVEEEAAPLPGGLVQQGGGELVHCWRNAGLGGPIVVRPHLHPGHGLRLRGHRRVGESGALRASLAVILLVESQQGSDRDYERDLSGLMSKYISVLHFL